MGGAIAAAVGLGGTLTAEALAADTSDGASPDAPPSGTPTTTESCYVLTSEAVEGPYYLGMEQFRSDIREGQEGIPLTLRLKVIDAATCEPVRNAAVDVWQCTAMGIYSGFEALDPSVPPPPGQQGSTDAERYLRGTWKTDKGGHVQFKSIFPGWYVGRTVHIHVKVHVDGTWTDTGYEGGHVCHTGQLFFDESAVLRTAQLEPYSTNTTVRTTLDEDRFYSDNGHEGGLLFLDFDTRNIARGVRATLTMGVAPESTPPPTIPQPQPTASAS